MKKKRSTKKLTPEQKAEQLKKRKELAFRKKIRNNDCHNNANSGVKNSIQ